MAKVALNEICEILNGYAFKSEKYVDAGVRIIRITNVQKGYVEDEKPQFYSEEDMINHQEYMLREDDLLISLTGNVGRVALLEKCFLPAALNQRVACLRTKSDKVNKKYVFYALLSKKFENDCIVSAKGIAQKNMSTEWVKQYKIEFPDTDKQQEIVDLMDRLSSVIDSRKQELEELDNLTKSRFVEMFGTIDNPVQEFRQNTLKELCNKITDGKHGGCTKEEGTERYFVGAREIYDDEIHYDTAPEINVTEFEKDYKRCNIEIGDFLIVNTGATIGKSAIATDAKTEHTLLQKSVALLKVKREILNPVFLKWCYRVNTKMYIVESASAQPNLLLSKINATEIYVPDIELQNQFADFVTETDKLKFRKGGTVMCKFVIKNAFYGDKSIA